MVSQPTLILHSFLRKSTKKKSTENNVNITSASTALDNVTLVYFFINILLYVFIDGPTGLVTAFCLIFSRTIDDLFVTFSFQETLTIASITGRDLLLLAYNRPTSDTSKAYGCGRSHDENITARPSAAGVRNVTPGI